MNARPKGLGRGLDAIFEIESSLAPRKQSATTMEMLSLDAVVPNPKQPRANFDPEALQELADSIATLGVIQPVTVMRDSEGRYVLISGERRWRASRLAGQETIPAYVREATEQSLHEMALVENIQREDLNAIEVALSLRSLVDECGLTQDALAARVGKKRSTVANYMRLLSLPVEVQLALREELISMGHAKAIASAEAADTQLTVLKKVLKKGLSVRQAEELARKAAEEKAPAPVEEEFPESYTRLVERLEQLFSQDISIKKNKKGGGKIVVEFASDSDIDTFLQRLGKA